MALLLPFVLFAGAVTLTAHAAVPRAAPRHGQGHVLYATRARLYLDRGADDGLASGMHLKLTRNGRDTGACVVEEVSAASAVCIGDGRARDSFSMPALGDGKAHETRTASDKSGAREVVATTPGRDRMLLGEADVRRLSRKARAQAESELAHAAHDFVEPPLEGIAARELRALPLEVALSHDGWVAVGGNSQRERLSLALRGAELPVGGLSLFADADVWYWSAGRADQAELLVWELSAAHRGAEPFSIAAGRIFPFGLHSIAALDGAEVGYRIGDDSQGLEFGAAFGLVPDPFTLDVRSSRWLAGLYVTHSLRHSDGIVRLSREAAHVAVRNLDGGRVRVEGELEALLFLFDGVELGASGLLSTQMASSQSASSQSSSQPAVSQPALEGARAHVRLTPLPGLALLAAVRRVGPSTVTDADLGPTVAGDAGLTAGDVQASYAVAPFLSLGVNAGVVGDGAAGQARQFVGPEVGLPELLGRYGSGSLGYQEEIGSYSGRSAFAQLVILPAGRVSWLARLSYFDTRPGPAATAWREVGAYVHADAHLADWLVLRGSMLSRLAVTGYAEERAVLPPAGLTMQLELEGRPW